MLLRSKPIRYAAVVFVIIVFLFESTIVFSESASSKLEEKYAEAEWLMVEGKYDDAAIIFDTLGSYSDSSKMAMYCKAISAAELSQLYPIAIDTFSKLGDFRDCSQLVIYYTGRYNEATGDEALAIIDTCADEYLDAAIKAYKLARDSYNELALFKDSLTRYASCGNKIDTLNAEKEKRSLDAIEQTYQEALELEKEHKWDSAIAKYKKVIHYKDSEERISACESNIIKDYYDEGMTKFSNEDWDGAIAAFSMAGDYDNAKDMILQAQDKKDEPRRKMLYDKGVQLMDSGDYSGACRYFSRAEGYANSFDLLAEARIIANKEVMKHLKKVKDTFSFGLYEQDANSSNGCEEIDWIVMAIDGKKALLISKNAVDCKPFNEEHVDVTWETSTIRQWLNNEFFHQAFSEEEQKWILETNVNNKSSRGYNGGNNTKDRIFLLSDDETVKYFPKEKDRICKMNKSIFSQLSAEIKDTHKLTSSNDAFRYWLRSACIYDSWKIYCGPEGKEGAWRVDYEYLIRPALWIDLNAEIY